MFAWLQKFAWCDILFSVITCLTQGLHNAHLSYPHNLNSNNIRLTWYVLKRRPPLFMLWSTQLIATIKLCMVKMPMVTVCWWLVPVYRNSQEALSILLGQILNYVGWRWRFHLWFVQNAIFWNNGATQIFQWPTHMYRMSLQLTFTGHKLPISMSLTDMTSSLLGSMECIHILLLMAFPMGVPGLNGKILQSLLPAITFFSSQALARDMMIRESGEDIKF